MPKVHRHQPDVCFDRQLCSLGQGENVLSAIGRAGNAAVDTRNRVKVLAVSSVLYDRPLNLPIDTMLRTLVRSWCATRAR